MKGQCVMSEAAHAGDEAKKVEGETRDAMTN